MKETMVAKHAKMCIRDRYIEDVKKAKEAYDTLSEEEKNTISPLDREFLNGALVTVEQLNTEARDCLLYTSLQLFVYMV